jgi:hypothetical protein
MVRELRWDVAMLMEHGIVGVGRRRWLTTLSRTAAEWWRRWSSGEATEETKMAVRMGKSSRRGLLDALRSQEERGQAGAATGDRRRDVAAAGDNGTTWRGGEKLAGVGRAVGG